jgi:transcriptional regulator with XRE-family HTH domain
LINILTMTKGINTAALKFKQKLVRDMPTFGEYVKSWREKQGLTRSELARLLGVSVTHVSNVERDLSPSSKSGSPPQISREMCDQISRVLQVPRHIVYMAAYVPELLDDTRDDPRTRRLLAVFEDLNPERQDEVVAYVEMLWRMDVKPPTDPKPGRKPEHTLDRKK